MLISRLLWALGTILEEAHAKNSTPRDGSTLVRFARIGAIEGTNACGTRSARSDAILSESDRELHQLVVSLCGFTCADRSTRLAVQRIETRRV
jgi:hypothetical protein